MSSDVELPEGQKEFKLSEVCKLANVQPYMLRFWGTEFPQLEAERSGTGQRVYARAHKKLSSGGGSSKSKGGNRKSSEPPAQAAEPDPVEVDKRVQERVQPLLATLRDLRSEVAEILADLQRGT